MSYYVAAYDTEAVYPWWDGRQKGFSYTPAHITEFLEGVDRGRQKCICSATRPPPFSSSPKMLELAGATTARHPRPSALRHPVPYLHPSKPDRPARRQSPRSDTSWPTPKKLIEDTFGRRGDRPDRARRLHRRLPRPPHRSRSHVGGRLPLCAQRRQRSQRHPARPARPALLVYPGRIPQTAGNTLPCLARQHPDRPAGPSSLAAALALAVSRKNAPGTHRASTKPTRPASTTLSGTVFSTTCLSSTPGPSTASTNRPRR